MSVLFDTNILLRSAQPTHPMCATASRAVTSLLRQNETVFFCAQTIAEFWNVATRPLAVNGLGLSHAEVVSEVRSIEGMLTLLPDSPGIYPRWKRLVDGHKVQGVRVFDTRLVAVAQLNGVESILTFNAGDFRRYDGISIPDPTSFLS